MILAATSVLIPKAALEGFKDVEELVSAYFILLIGICDSTTTDGQSNRKECY